MRSTVIRASAVILLLISLGFTFYIMNSNLFKGPAAPPKALTRLKYYVASGASNEFRAQIIKKYNIDKNHGLDIEFISSDPGELEKQLISGQSQIAEVSPFSAITAYKQGNALKIIAASLHFTYTIAISENSKAMSLSDLKGVRLGVLPKPTAAYQALDLVLNSAGMDIEKDFKLTFGTIPQIVESLQKGTVDAAMVSYPSAAKIYATGKFRSSERLERFWVEKEKLPMPFVVVAAQESWLNQNKETAKNLVETLFDAALYMQKYPESIASLTAYPAKNTYDAPAEKLVEENLPKLYFTAWTDLEYNGLKREFQRAKEIHLIPADSPSADMFIIPPGELGFK